MAKVPLLSHTSGGDLCGAPLLSQRSAAPQSSRLNLARDRVISHIGILPISRTRERRPDMRTAEVKQAALGGTSAYYLFQFSSFGYVEQSLTSLVDGISEAQGPMARDG